MAVIHHKLPAHELAQRNRWYVFVRLLLLLVIGVPGILSLVLFQGWSSEVQRDVLFLIIALSSNLLFLWLRRLIGDRARGQGLLALGFIVCDIVFVTAVIYTNGAIESRSAILYTIPILISGALFGRAATYLAAGMSGGLYAVLIVADYFKLIPSVGVIDPGLHGRLSYVVNSVVFIPAILFVVALGVDFITTLLIEKERQAQQHLAGLVRAQEIARIGSWDWNVDTDEIHWSDGMLKIFGLSERPRQLQYDSYLKMVHPDDVAEHRRTVQKAIQSKSSFSVDHRSVLPDGSVRYMHGEGRPEFDPDGRVIRMSGTAQDVTEAHHLDNAKREFVSLASHQLRTPASGVKAYLSLLLDGYAGDISKPQREFITKAHDANNRQLDIIDNLLNLAAIESGHLMLHKSPVDLNALVKQCLPNHVPQIRMRRQKLTTTYSPRPCMIRADATHLQMAIDNLLSNAIKYTPDKGRITITITAKKASAFVAVTDTGIGISPENIKSLFKKFSRLRDPASKTVGGSGLGLYLAQFVAREHGGSITVRSRHGEGTTFRIRLPLLSEKAYDRVINRKI